MLPTSVDPEVMKSPRMIVTFLGTGTSTGVPMIGCECHVCRSSNPRDKRMRPSIVVSVDSDSESVPMRNLLVDTTPEMRLQTLRAGVGRIEAVLTTHHHADHIFGMDDIRQFNFRQGGAIPIYGDRTTLDHIRMVFEYAFRATPAAGGKPQMDLTSISSLQSFEVSGVTITPLTVFHGTDPIIAYKFGSRFAYVTDVSRIPDETFEQLRGLDTIVLSAVRHEEHPTHFSVGQAIEKIAQLAPRQAFLTHLSHHIDHERDSIALPPGVGFAYDGLQVSIPASQIPASTR